MSDGSRPFWQCKPLQELSKEEWEALCDGCGRCCLHKLQDEDTGQVFYTNVACRLLDLQSCRCRDYAHRASVVADCLALSPQTLGQQLCLFPSTCAYRLLAEGRDLPEWHPLVSGRDETVMSSGHRVCGRVIPEDQAQELEQHLVDWC